MPKKSAPWFTELSAVEAVVVGVTADPNSVFDVGGRTVMTDRVPLVGRG